MGVFIVMIAAGDCSNAVTMTMKSHYDETALNLVERADSSVNQAERRQIAEILRQHPSSDTQEEGIAEE